MINKTEQNIMKNWNGNNSEPLVSICTIVYNHEPFIAKALDSFLMQETNFPFEIVISEDASTDNTANIIKKYMKQFPNIINTNLRNVNVGQNSNIIENQQRAKGKYIALCEGDDYWTDKNKLQIQIDVLQKNKEIDMCLHLAVKIDELGKQKDLVIGGYLDNDGIIPVEDIILKTKGQIPTASTVYRQKVVEDIVEFHRQRPWLTAGDIYIHFFGAKHGGAYFINKPMSTYRHYSEGSWSSMYKDDYKKRLKHAYCRIKSYEELDKITMNQFTLVFKQANKKRLLWLIHDPGIPYWDKVLFTFRHGKYFSINEKIAYYGFVLIPFASYIPRNLLKKILNIRYK